MSSNSKISYYGIDCVEVRKANGHTLLFVFTSIFTSLTLTVPSKTTFLQCNPKNVIQGLLSSPGRPSFCGDDMRSKQISNNYYYLDCLPSVKSEASCGGLLQGKESIQNTSKIHEFSYLLLVSIPINPIDPIYEYISNI